MPNMFRLTGLVTTLMLALAVSPLVANEKREVAIFAGGCFWCVEADFDKVPGVERTISGYAGGTLKNPTYTDVVAGGTGHREAVYIVFDPEKVSYETLLDVFWHSVDPTDDGGQFCDRGMSYTTAIYAASHEQLRQAEASRKALEESGVLKDPIVTHIGITNDFYSAESHHQDYYRKNLFHYGFYRARCGRDDRIRDLWGDAAFRGMTKE